ncbi:hypothetical protein Pyn_19550 [Prunus yedoensis var. nudiflora]|uniref:Bifunctional lysine-specific demethylase and histidyl-hydroxylase n=1 Tax=Prunus yedoensis var. nudiflora TaxID=2094558 RepID=A0A314XQ09_PRUYE|nr:hypothetical protein Pyn_19550 [Prunus yedoensis var. nudiflora]
MVSCLPISSDELNILTFLEEVKIKLGCPLVCQQDIRVLRTDSHLKREVHFFQESLNSCCIEDPHYFTIEEVLKCQEAYKEGYTIALRGMEFRFESLAAIADELAFLFGQPSVGANMYLTPPNSQGLARHYDDHCVFVCQLLGTRSNGDFFLNQMCSYLDCMILLIGYMVQKFRIQWLNANNFC